MGLLKSISLLRVTAVAACLAAGIAYSSHTPRIAYACEESGCCTCSAGGSTYSDGACNGTSECRCMYQGTDCIGCQWVNNSANCKPLIE
jgi:hypothetical protein